jgi:hypothetical protein
MTKEQELVKHIRDHLKEHGFRLILGRGKKVNVGDARCEGYFSVGDTKKERQIRVAKAGETWIYVLAHEYCHFLQWLETPQRTLDSQDNAQHIVHCVSVGQVDPKWKQSLIRWAFRVVAENERDCERRTVRLLEEWSIPFNKDMYIKKANLYVYLHHMWREYHFLKTKFNVYKSNKILDILPNNFKAQSHIVVPKAVRRELDRAFA